MSYICGEFTEISYLGIFSPHFSSVCIKGNIPTKSVLKMLLWILSRPLWSFYETWAILFLMKLKILRFPTSMEEIWWRRKNSVQILWKRWSRDLINFRIYYRKIKYRYSAIHANVMKFILKFCCQWISTYQATWNAWNF